MTASIDGSSGEGSGTRRHIGRIMGLPPWLAILLSASLGGAPIGAAVHSMTGASPEVIARIAATEKDVAGHEERLKVHDHDHEKVILIEERTRVMADDLAHIRVSLDNLTNRASH